MFILLWQNWKDNIADQFPSLLGENCFADVTLIAENKKCKVHSCVISLFSKYLKGLVEDGMANNGFGSPVSIVFSDVTFEALQLVVNYMYCGQIEVGEEFIADVLFLAKCLGIESLLQLQYHVPDNIAQMSEQTDVISKPWGPEMLKKFSKNISADIFLVSNVNVVSVSDLEISDTESFSDLYEEDGKCKKRKVVIKKEFIPKKQFKKSKSYVGENEIAKLNSSCMKIYLLNEIELFSCNDGNNTQSISLLDKLGINVVNETAAAPTSSQTKSVDDVASELIEGRFRREISKLWHELQAMTLANRKSFINGIRNDTIKNVFLMLKQEESVAQILKELKLKSRELMTIILMLLGSKYMSVEMAVESFRYEEENQPVCRKSPEKPMLLFKVLNPPVKCEEVNTCSILRVNKSNRNAVANIIIEEKQPRHTDEGDSSKSNLHEYVELSSDDESDKAKSSEEDTEDEYIEEDLSEATLNDDAKSEQDKAHESNCSAQKLKIEVDEYQHDAMTTCEQVVTNEEPPLKIEESTDRDSEVYSSYNYDCKSSEFSDQIRAALLNCRKRISPEETSREHKPNQKKLLFQVNRGVKPINNDCFVRINKELQSAAESKMVTADTNSHLVKKIPPPHAKNIEKVDHTKKSQAINRELNDKKMTPKKDTSVDVRKTKTTLKGDKSIDVKETKTTLKVDKSFEVNETEKILMGVKSVDVKETKTPLKGNNVHNVVKASSVIIRANDLKSASSARKSQKEIVTPDAKGNQTKIRIVSSIERRVRNPKK